MRAQRRSFNHLFQEPCLMTHLSKHLFMHSLSLCVGGGFCPSDYLSFFISLSLYHSLNRIDSLSLLYLSLSSYSFLNLSLSTLALLSLSLPPLSLEKRGSCNWKKTKAGSKPQHVEIVCRKMALIQHIFMFVNPYSTGWSPPGLPPLFNKRWSLKIEYYNLSIKRTLSITSIDRLEAD